MAWPTMMTSTPAHNRSVSTDSIEIRLARPDDAPDVVSILVEAASWLEQAGSPMWKDDELRAEQIAADIHDGLFVVACAGALPVGTVKFQLTDPIFWPDMPDGDAAYVHRLAVRRSVAGSGVAAALIDWAAARTASLGRACLRLDCEADRTRLRAFYERLGFRHHSDRGVGPYFVSRYELRVRSVSA